MSEANPLLVRVMRLPHGEDLPLPHYQTAEAAGCDLLAAVAADTPLVLAPGARALVPTGLMLEIPPGYEGQVRPRSGLALKHGLGLPNAPGTIDADYRGEIGVLLINWGDAPVEITRGMRIAQLVVAPVTRAVFAEAASLADSARGAGGFGSTGTGRGGNLMLLPRRGLLAIAAVVDVALHARPQPVAAKALAERLGLPPRYLEPLLQALVRADILRGMRGPRGGYELARERRRITVAAVLRAIQAVDTDGDAGAVPPIVRDVVAPAVARADGLFLAELDQITMDDMCRTAGARQSAKAMAASTDFTI